MDKPLSLISAYIDGEVLSQEQFAVLERWVCASKENAAEFARRSFDSQEVRSYLIAEHSEGLVFLDSAKADDQLEHAMDLDDDQYASEVMQLVVDQALAMRRQYAIEDEANRMLAAQQAEQTRENRCHVQPREPQPVQHVIVIPKLLALLGVAALIGLVVWIGLMSSPPEPTQFRAENPNPETNMLPQTPPAIVAIVRSSVDAQWAGREAGHQYLRSGTPVTLTEGYVEVVFGTDATVIVEAPATINPTGPNAMRLVSGRIAAQVPDTARGFTVATANGIIVDHGTSFGVDVATGHATQVVVFDGLVTVQSNVTDAASSEPVPLHAGRMAHLSSDANIPLVITDIDAQANATFVRSMANAESAAFHYRRTILASQPIAYWDFEGDLGQEVPNLVNPGTHNLLAIGNPRVDSAGVVGQGAYLSNVTPPYSYFETEDTVGELTETGDFTLELWFRADRYAWGVLMDVYADRPLRGAEHFALLELQPDHHQGGYEVPGLRPNSLRGLHRDPPGPSSETGTNLFSPRSYEPGHWHHAVLVKRGDRLSLYLDGEQVGESRAQTTIAPQTRISMGISSIVRLPGDRPAADYRSFQGGIDEVAVYGRALSAEEVATHWVATGLAN